MTEIVDISFQNIKNGDIKSYELLFKTHYSKIVNYAYKMIRNKEAAEEIAQDLFFQIWERKDNIEIKESIINYLFRATKFKCIDYIKDKIKNNKNFVHIDDENFHLQLVEEGQYDENQDEYIKKLVNQAIEKLPPKCKEIFILSRFVELTHKEIAEKLQISTNTIENQLAIANKKLKETILPYYDKIYK